MADPVPASHSASPKIRRERDLPPASQRKQDWSDDVDKISLLKVTIFAEDAGKELSPGSFWKAPYPITLGKYYCSI
jgi:hypothetical protein